jgi:DNA-binding transcriptional LysR family regulator
MFDLIDMRIVQLAGEEDSLTAIAKRVNLTKSAVTTRLQKLEDKLGRRLINRKQHGFGITADGQIFLQHAKRIANELALLDERFKKTYSSELLICCEPSFSSLPMRVVSQFHQVHSGVPLHFHVGDIDTCFSRLVHKRADIMIVHEPRDLIHIEFDPLFQERLVVAFHPDSPLAQESGPVFTEQLQDFPYIKWSGAPQKMFKRLNSTFQNLPIVASSEDLNTALDLASLGLGWVIVTERLVRSHLGRPLVHRLIADRWAFLDVYVGWRSTDKRHDLHDFLDLIRDAY